MTAGPAITADDVIRAGACAEGVYDAIERISERQRLPSAIPLSTLLPFLINEEERNYALRAAQFDGRDDYDYAYGSSGGRYGTGYGYGNSYGLGYSFGSGYGYGNSYGFVDDFGNGDGYGDGFGFGPGSGYGYGDGYGDGSGYGKDYGYGSGYRGSYGYGEGSGSYGCINTTST